MKYFFAFTLAALTLIGAASAQAPADALKVKVDVKKVSVTEQQTPQYAAGNVKDKRWRPKNWVEVEVDFDIKLPVDAGGNKGSFGSMQLNVFLALQHKTKEGKVEVLKGTLNLINIPAGETCHALAYVSPASMKSIFQKDNVLVSTDVSQWGVEFLVDGKRIAGDSSVGKQPWWDSPDAANKFQMLEGVMVSKADSPFAILWGDYDVPVAKK
jgi:hypothetical protein